MGAKSPVLMPEINHLSNFNGKELGFYRSGSAPPTVEGSLDAINELNLSEFANDPNYLSYYYSSVGNRNPRMPPPVLSKEDWRSTQRLGGIGDKRKSNRNLEDNVSGSSNYSNGNGGGNSSEWLSGGGDGLIGLSLGRQKRLAEDFQDDNCRTTFNPNYSSRAASHNAFEGGDQIRYTETCVPLHYDRHINMAGLQNKTSQSFASVVTPTLPRNNSNNYCASDLVESENLVAALSGMNLLDSVSQIDAHRNFLLDLKNTQGQVSRSLNRTHSSNSSYLESSNSSFLSRPTINSSSYLNPGSSLSSSSHYLNDSINGLNGYSIDPTVLPMGTLPPLFENAANASAIAALSPNRNIIDSQYIQYLKMAEYANVAQANASLTEQSYLDLLKLKQYEQYAAQFLGNNAHNLNMSYPVSPLRHTERNLRFNPSMSSNFGGVAGSWHMGLNGNVNEGFPSTLLEEFKSNKARCFELSEIAGFVVEFSADQFGSRFIQQKLETATTEEKDMVFEEIMTHALTLMTDVFGNYVIQKFFEHGSQAQIRELANQLYTHVLELSLQMYGCRVIQKAIEVVNVDQQTKMVAELDGHIMRCVRDQNGNHVIQKCIECIPQEAIQFIIYSFYDHIVTLSTHPYGCRVIQRVLEHCNDPKTQKIVMDEIMQCVCMLAQDQYGNYVIQHVLEHGKPHERSEIIKQLAGHIIQMSQQKFASNVVEKCLTFGGPIERQILVNEMLGSTDENEPLQAMMKDQFANYVVQKVLETCDDQQRELILSRIKVHLNALKKYTYGKHIVARVEKLVAAGERRIGLQSSYPSYMA